MINQAAFTDDIEFENGKLTVFGISLSGKSILIVKTVSECAGLNPNLSFKPLALHRDEFTLLVNGDTILNENDIIYFISQKEYIEDIIKLCGKTSIHINNVMIIGGSKIGLNIAQLLENHQVTIVEKDKAKCEKIASFLKKTLVINIDGHDVKQLEEEGLADMDALISVTANSEMNVITSLVGKKHGIKKTIARVENFNYINLSQSIGIDTIINKNYRSRQNI